MDKVIENVVVEFGDTDSSGEVGKTLCRLSSVYHCPLKLDKCTVNYNDT